MFKIALFRQAIVGHLFLTRSMGVASSSQTLKDAPVPNATAETLTMKVNTPLHIYLTI
jgi:hypothetical protein